MIVHASRHPLTHGVDVVWPRRGAGPLMHPPSHVLTRYAVMTEVVPELLAR